ncbi:MAG: GyrI-like domain-containing protein [Trebonia sp.]
MPANDVQVKEIPAARVAELTALAPDYEPESIGPVAGPMFRDLAGIERAATIVHRGPMDAVMPTGQALARWIDENGYRPLGLLREVYLETAGGQDNWVTELQAPVARLEGWTGPRGRDWTGMSRPGRRASGGAAAWRSITTGRGRT